MGLVSVIVTLSLVEQVYECVVLDFDAVTLSFDAFVLVLLTAFKILKRWRVLRNFVRLDNFLLPPSLYDDTLTLLLF